MWHSIRVLLRAWKIVIFLGFVGLLGCASGPATRRPAPTSPMTQKDTSLFDDGVDFVGQAGGFQGGWFGRWQHELDQRFDRADTVALVAIESFNESQRQGAGTSTYVLSPQSEQVFKGVWPEGETLVSGVRSGGFASLRRGGEQVLEGRYVLFVKWVHDDSGAIEPRWHLSRAGEGVMERVTTRFGQTRADDTVVVRHTN